MSTQSSIYHQTTSEITKEADILAKAVKNPQAFAPIYDKYFLQIFRYILQRVENEQIASDLTSDVFAKALFNLKKYKFKGAPFSAWLYRVAFNEIATRHRKNKLQRTINITEDVWSLFTSEEKEDEQEFSSQQLAHLKTCLSQLKTHEVELIEMRFFEDRPFKEIGEILDITTENARVKTHRALKKLQKVFKAI